MDKRGSFFKVNGAFIQNIKYVDLCEMSAAECAVLSDMQYAFSGKWKVLLEHFFLQADLWLDYPPVISYVYYFCMWNRIFGVKQVMAFFAANAENINFIMHRHKITGVFINWICVI